MRDTGIVNPINELRTLRKDTHTEWRKPVAKGHMYPFSYLLTFPLSSDCHRGCQRFTTIQPVRHESPLERWKLFYPVAVMVYSSRFTLGSRFNLTWHWNPCHAWRTQRQVCLSLLSAHAGHARNFGSPSSLFEIAAVIAFPDRTQREKYRMYIRYTLWYTSGGGQKVPAN